MKKSSKVIKDFGNEWSRFPQDHDENELKSVYQDYFHLVPDHIINEESICLDVGCGSGRWSKFVAPRVERIYCLDPSQSALEVAKRNLSSFTNCEFLNTTADNISLEENSIDFAYSLGVLHHVENTDECIKEIYKKLKPGKPFLIYLYYRFDNRSKLYSFAWRLSEVLRWLISKLPFTIKKIMTDIIALIIYLPLSRSAFLLHKLGINSRWLPLSYYKDKSFYTMRTDSLDRFGTTLEKRYTKEEIGNLLANAGFNDIDFSNRRPYWVSICYKPQ